MHCTNCKGADIGQIRFSTVASGVEFHYCRRCEHRWWTSEDRTLDLDSVLEQAATPLSKAS